MTYYKRKLSKSASERGKRMANARWAQDRARRDFLATHDPVVTGRVMRRIIDVDETSGTVTEIVIRDYDSAREIRRKLCSVGLTLSVKSIP